MVKRICLKCKKVFWVQPNVVKSGRGKYCSKKCWYATNSIILKNDKERFNNNFGFKKGITPWNKGKECLYMHGENNPKWRQKIEKKCPECGKIFFVIPSKEKYRKFCSIKCRGKHNFTGICHDQGYVWIYKPSHPRAHKKGGKCGFVKRSYLVIEKVIGRYVRIGEIVHHKNRIRNDDRPENLQLCANHSEHTKIHSLSNRVFI